MDTPHCTLQRLCGLKGGGLAILEGFNPLLTSGHPELTSWVTRLPTWMGGGVGTEETFTCQARGLALNTW